MKETKIIDCPVCGGACKLPLYLLKRGIDEIKWKGYEDDIPKGWKIIKK